MKRSMSATARRTVRRAVTWRPKQRGTEPIDIAALISPLRYDVRVRADLFRMLGERERDEPLEALMPLVRSSAYAVWFARVAMARFRPWVLEDEALHDEQLRERVRTARALYWSFRDRGFDPRYPVVLRSTSRPMESDTGALIRPRIHVGDGGHRLALLLASDGVAAPGTYLVDPRPMPIFDNTARLFGPEDAEGARYLGFIARGYLPAQAPVPASADDLVTAVTDVGGAEAGAEVRGVLDAHRRAWASGTSAAEHG